MASEWQRKVLSHEPPAVRNVLLNDRTSKHIPTLTRLARDFPKSYPLRSRLVEALRKQGRHKASLREWRLTTITFPTAPNPFFQRARWAARELNYKEAVLSLSKCLRLDRGYFRTSAIFQRAQCNMRLGNLDLAEQDLARLPNGYEDVRLNEWHVCTKEQLLGEIQAQRASHGPDKSLERTREG